MRATLMLLSHLLMASSFVFIANVQAEDKPAAAAPLHKFSGSYGVDYLFEPNEEAETYPEQEYKKQRAIVYPSFKYTYDSKFSFGLTPEFRYNNGYQNGGYNTRPGKVHFARALFTAMVNNVLTEKDHGLKVDMGYVRRVFNQTTNPGNYGNHRFRVFVSKKLNDTINFSVNNDFLYNATVDWKDSDWKLWYNPISTVNFTLSEKLSFMMYYDWSVRKFHREQPNKENIDIITENSNILTYTFNDVYSAGSNFKFDYNLDRSEKETVNFYVAPFVTKNLTDKISLSFEVSWTTHKEGDGKKGLEPKEKFWEYPDMAIYYSQVLF